MKNLLIILSLITSFAAEAYSQSSGELFFSGNYNFFNMWDLKDQQTEMLTDLTSQGIPAEATESYPAYWGFKAGLLVPLDPANTYSVRIGPFVSYMSTGARIAYSDYSGAVRADQITSAVAAGGILSFYLKDFSYVSLRMDLYGMLLFSSLENTIFMKIGDQVQTEKLDFSATSLGIEPAFRIMSQFGVINFGVSASYLIAFPADLEADKYTDAYFVNQSGSKISIDWSGFKFGFLASISF